MGKNKPNTYVLGSIIRSLYHVAGRRTTAGFAAKVIGSIIKTLEQKYYFLEHVTIVESGDVTENEAIQISPEIEKVKPSLIGKAIESIIRVVYMDIIGKSGLFFIAEIKRRAGDELITELQNYGVDLISLQIEQHYLYRSRERRTSKVGRDKTSDVSLLGYTWKNVASWEYDTNKKTCVLYNNDGEILDNLHLDTIIENYVKSLSEDLEEVPEELEKHIDLSNKEYEFLRMLQSRDMDVDLAVNLLHIDKDEFDVMVKKLLHNELLQYTSFNVVELTETGINYINKREKQKDQIEASTPKPETGF
jgi:hypothetical protein